MAKGLQSTVVDCGSGRGGEEGEGEGRGERHMKEGIKEEGRGLLREERGKYGRDGKLRRRWAKEEGGDTSVPLRKGSISPQAPLVMSQVLWPHDNENNL